MAARRSYMVEWKLTFLQNKNITIQADLNLVLSNFLLYKKNPFCVEISANDGVSNDQLFPFIQQKLIRELLIEPIPEVFINLKESP
jgi:hypothetical protein